MVFRCQFPSSCRVVVLVAPVRKQFEVDDGKQYRKQTYTLLQSLFSWAQPYSGLPAPPSHFTTKDAWCRLLRFQRYGNRIRQRRSTGNHQSPPSFAAFAWQDSNRQGLIGSQHVSTRTVAVVGKVLDSLDLAQRRSAPSRLASRCGRATRHSTQKQKKKEAARFLMAPPFDSCVSTHQE